MDVAKVIFYDVADTSRNVEKFRGEVNQLVRHREPHARDESHHVQFCLLPFGTLYVLPDHG